MYRQRYPDDPGMHNTGDYRGGRRTHIERAPTCCEQLRTSIVVSLIGLVLVPVAIGILGYNEGRAVKTAQSLDEGLASVYELKSTHVVEPQLNGHLIHLSDKISCDEVLSDSLHGVAVSAVSLHRNVEMYQWIEQEHREEHELANGDKEVTKSYSYDEAWRSDLVSSSSFDSPFNHKNPDSMPVKKETFTQSRVSLGAFQLSTNLIAGINKLTDLTPKVLPDNRPELKLYGKYIYYGDDPQYPKVGDVRVSFSYGGLCRDSKLGAAQMVSVMAKQDGFTLTGYQTEAGNILEMISLAEKSAYEMIQSAHSENTMITWLLRGLGMFINFLGFTCLTSMIRTTVSYIPIVRHLVYMSLVAFNIAVSMSISLTTIAISWIWFRPLMAAGILAMAASFIILPRLRSEPQNTGRRMV